MDPPDEVCTTLRTPVAARRFGQAHRADDVDRSVELRVGHRAPHVDLRRQVEHHLGPVLVEDRVQIRGHDVRLDEDVGGIVGQMLEVGCATGREIVQPHNRVTVCQQTVD